MTNIRVLLLGPPEVRLGGRPIPIQRRVTRALLYYLASRGGMVGREELLALFWENQADTVARRRLRESLSRLRKALPGSDLLLSDVNLVGLNFDQVYVDQLEFQDLIDKAGRIPWQLSADQPLPEHTYQILHQAINLWRSPRFLAGIDLPSTRGLDNWLASNTQRMEHLREHILERLSDHADAVGDLEQALQLARLALLGDELNEDLHYRVLSALLKMGRRSEAREYFNYLEGLLRHDLDTSPSPKLVELYRQIRIDSSLLPSPESQPIWNLHPSMQVPFVGRGSELAQLKRCFQKGGGVFLLGESGQGKTRLIQEFVKQIKDHPRLMLANCRPAENNLPFQPVIELLRHQVQPDEWLALSPTWASQLTLLLPELMTMRSELERPVIEFAPETAPGQARALLFEAIHQVFLLISKNRQLLLCLDDAQWADEATLATIAYLLERPPFDHQAMLIVAARGEEKNLHLQTLQNSLQGSSHIQFLPVSRLSLDEVTELTRFAFGYSPIEDFNKQLAEETGGNPLFVLETIRALLEQPVQPDPSQPVRLPLAESVQSLIHARLQQLNPQTREILEIAAIIGIEFDPEIVTAIGQQTGLEVIRGLEELERRLLIEPLSRSLEDIRYRFIHSKIREVLLQEINPMRASWLHGKVAHALEHKLRHKAVDQAAVLAQHYEYAGEASPAFDFWVRAGKRARQLFANTDAVQAFSHAEQLIPLTPDLSDEQIHDLYIEWTELAYEVEDASTIQRLNTDLLRLGQDRSSSLLIGTAMKGLSDVCMVTNQYEEGLSYTIQAISYLEHGNNVHQHMATYICKGVFLYMLNRIEESIEAFQDALAVGASSGDFHVLRARANAHYQLSIAQILRGWPETALNHAIRSLADFTALNRAYGQVTAYSALAVSHYFTGKLNQARQDSQLGIELAERIQAWRMLGYLHGYRSMIDMAMGHSDESIEHALQAIDLGERYGHDEIAAGGYRFLGDLFMSVNAPHMAVNYYQQALQASEDKFLAVDHMFRLGLAQCYLGELESGRALVQQSIDISQNAGMGVILIMAQLFQVWIYLIREKWDNAGQLALHVQKEALNRGFTSVHLLATSLLGDIALHENNIPNALGYYRRAASGAAKMPNKMIELDALNKLVNALRRFGLPDSAPRKRAEEILNYIDAMTQKDLIREAFQEYRRKITATWS